MEEDITRKIDYLFNNEKGKQLLDAVISYITPLLADLSERRLSLPFASIFLSMVLSGEYAAERTVGKEPGQAYEKTLESLRAVCRVAEKILRENYESGELEKLYNDLLHQLSSGEASESGASGSEHGPARSE
ncbi:MAG: hypothetical protein F7C34_05225 [Desulfurococcales archaeon]|nr:hypothetical protein [Desulfurococcales archaeon]